MNEATWMLSSVASVDYADAVSVVVGDRFVSGYNAAVRPAIYLKSNVQINCGAGV